MPAAILALAQFAPMLMRYFGVGETSAAVAEKVVAIASTVTGAKTPEEAVKAMQDNDQLAQQFNLAVMAENGRLEEMHLSDRKDARARDIEIRKASGGSNRRADLMLVLAVVSIIVIVLVLAFTNLNPASAVAGFLMTIGGMFARNIGTAFDFEFGSSRSSRDKDELLVKKNGA